jgi:hypothetical protein
MSNFTRIVRRKNAIPSNFDHQGRDLRRRGRTKKLIDGLPPSTLKALRQGARRKAS